MVFDRQPHQIVLYAVNGSIMLIWIKVEGKMVFRSGAK